MLALRRSVNATARAVKNTAVPTRRWFGEALTIPTDREQQAGRRKEELDAEAGGGVGFNRDPIVPASDAGTKENPILVRRTARVFCLLLRCVSHSSTLSLSLSLSLTHPLSLSLSHALSQSLSALCLQVPSGVHCRVVGYEDPATHQLVWFNLNAGPLHYVPDVGLYFKLKKI